MSLINQALRKAQRDRTPNRMADSGSGTNPHSPAAGANGMKPGLMIGLIIAVAVLLGLVAGLSVVLLKGGDPSNVAQQAPAAAEKAATGQIAPETQPTESAETTPVVPEKPITPQITSTAESTPLERTDKVPLVEELRQAREAAEAKVAAEAEVALAEAKAAKEAAEKAAARAAAEPSQEIIDWLSRAQISGVKLSETESKVILNGKSYAVGEYVNYALGLKVMIIQEKRILFVDENGKKYMKRI
jgi:rRNA maturation endonuclease Nob1